MKRASYKEAIEWIVFNDLPDEINDGSHISVCLIADIFDVSPEKVLNDVYKIYLKQERGKNELRNN